MDSFDGNRKVDRNEFLIGLKENGVQITKDEANLLLEFIDTNKDGTIDFDEFLIAIRVFLSFSFSFKRFLGTIECQKTGFGG